jgi:HAD superfamily hydrolase (TIGR01509 family)
MRTSLGLVIFDCDGVLVDSEPIAARVLAAYARDLGLALSAEDCIRRFTGISMAAVQAELGRDLGRPLPADFADRIRAADFAAFAAELRPVDGAAPAVDALTAAGFAVCVASSGAPEKIRFTLGLTGLADRFEPRLFSATMVARGKPAPDLFLLAAQRMGFAPAACTVVEDSTAGIRAARAASMRAIGFAGGGHCEPGHADLLRAAGAEQVLVRLGDLPATLGADNDRQTSFPPSAKPA